MSAQELLSLSTLHAAAVRGGGVDEHYLHALIRANHQEEHEGAWTMCQHALCYNAQREASDY